MADLYKGVFDGEAFPNATVINEIADEAILIGSPVISVAAGTGEINPRVEPTAVDTDPIDGVCVGGDNNGIWVDGTTTNDGNAAAAAGESVKVCTNGRCKVRVDGSVTAIAIGDPLAASSDGIAKKAIAGDYVFGRAKQASTSTDAILCEVAQEGIF